MKHILLSLWFKAVIQLAIKISPNNELLSLGHYLHIFLFKKWIEQKAYKPIISPLNIYKLIKQPYEITCNNNDFSGQGLDTLHFVG